MRLPPQSQSVDRSITMTSSSTRGGVQPAFLGALASVALPILGKAAIGAVKGVLN